MTQFLFQIISHFLNTSLTIETLERATSEMLPGAEADVALNLEICDLIRSKQASPQETMRDLRARLQHSNPNVQLLALSVSITILFVYALIYQVSS